MSSLHFVYSSMNAGKSTSLLQVAHNYEERNMHCLIIKPVVDTRDVGVVKSRIGVEKPCVLVDDSMNMRDVYNDYLRSERKAVYCILVDEAQFLTPQQVEQLASLVDIDNIPVMCFGLRTDFQGNLFAGSKRLFEIADKLKELKTICHCGKAATMVLRVIDGEVVTEGNQIQIGGNESYVSVCRHHHKIGKFC